MDNTFEFGGKKYKLSKLDAFKQLNIVRRIGPILSDLLPAMKDSGITKDTLKNLNNLSEAEKLESVSKFLSPIFMGLSKLSDEDTKKVFLGLLSSVELQQAATGNWARVATDEMIMFQDLELPDLCMLAGRAFMFNLQRFFNVLPQ